MAVVLICSFAVFASSQIIQTGTLSGTVRSDDQEPLPGVSVTIMSPALITPQLSTVTGQRGNFRFSALPPGLYTVKYEMSGFNTLMREDVRVSVGQTVTLNDTLAQATLEASVTVRGESPVVDVTASAMTTSYGKEFLETVPQQRLRIGNYFSLVPGASNDRFHGSTPGDQAFMIDGVNISDPLSGGILASWGFDIMEELSVDTGALRAEFGNARGAVINAITKSGGNDFSGMASFYFRNKSFQADNTTGTPLAGRFVGFKFEDDASFQLGGPVVKNKLWFFLSGEYLWYDETVAGYPYDQPDNIPINRSRNYIPYAKLSWQISPSDKLIFSYNYKNFKLRHTSASQYRNEDSTGIQNNPDSTFNLQLTKSFGSNFILDAKAGYVTHELAVRAKHDTVGIYDSVTRLYSENLYWNDVSRRPRFQFTMNATHFKDNWLGSHEFKAGVDLMHGWYQTIDTYFTDPYTGLGGLVYLRNGVPDYIIHYEDFDRKNRMLTIGGFIQDAWRPTQRLTLNLGLRIDHQEGIVPRQGQERSPVVYGGVTYDPRVSETLRPMIWDYVSPRVGLAWALDNVGKTVLKASYGRYYLT
ncbi:MAG: TonB-dependent receptor, partial [Chloroflexi bacterium]|nr:TonB-dependent receptor [Chloroflexota bacterium]